MRFIFTAPSTGFTLAAFGSFDELLAIRNLQKSRSFYLRRFHLKADTNLQENAQMATWQSICATK
jgi:hypothetical protein